MTQLTSGTGITPYSSNVFNACKIGAEEGDADAQYHLGVSYAQGDGVDLDLEQAVKWLKMSAKQENIHAKIHLGCLYCRGGPGLAQDLKKGFRWLQPLAVQGNPTAQSHLGFHSFKENPTVAVAWLQAAAEKGESYAQLNLAGCYEKGRGTPKNLKLAFQWYLKAATSGVSEAQYKVGAHLASTNLTNACDWWLKASLQNHALAQYHLGLCYALGKGVVKDMTSACYWLERSAEQSNADAQNYLGFLYCNGDPELQKDLIKAIFWYQKAAENGDAIAETNLKLLMNGMRMV